MYRFAEMVTILTVWNFLKKRKCVAIFVFNHLKNHQHPIDVAQQRGLWLRARGVIFQPADRGQIPVDAKGRPFSKTGASLLQQHRKNPAEDAKYNLDVPHTDRGPARPENRKGRVFS